MQISSRFSLAIHILSIVQIYQRFDNQDPPDGLPKKVTSQFISDFIGVSGTTVREITSDLRDYGSLDISHGKDGITLAKDAVLITFHDIYRAVYKTTDGDLFSFHKFIPQEGRFGENCVGYIRAVSDLSDFFLRCVAFVRLKKISVFH